MEADKQKPSSKFDTSHILGFGAKVLGAVVIIADMNAVGDAFMKWTGFGWLLCGPLTAGVFFASFLGATKRLFRVAFFPGPILATYVMSDMWRWPWWAMLLVTVLNVELYHGVGKDEAQRELN